MNNLIKILILLLLLPYYYCCCCCCCCGLVGLGLQSGPGTGRGWESPRHHPRGRWSRPSPERFALTFPWTSQAARRGRPQAPPGRHAVLFGLRLTAGSKLARTDCLIIIIIIIIINMFIFIYREVGQPGLGQL